MWVAPVEYTLLIPSEELSPRYSKGSRKSDGQDLPRSPEDLIATDDVGENVKDLRPGDDDDAQKSLQDIHFGPAYAPSQEVALELMTFYFEVWHPLLPFLHGPTFLHEIERFYTKGYRPHTHQQICFAAIIRCVFNIAHVDRPTAEYPETSAFKSSFNIYSYLGVLLRKNDLLIIQTLLAYQLYLTVTMSLRQACLLGGLISRSLQSAGLHRCPFRFQHLTNDECEMRKRIF